MYLQDTYKKDTYKKCENKECQVVMVGILKRSGKVAPRKYCYTCVKEGKINNVEHSGNTA